MTDRTIRPKSKPVHPEVCIGHVHLKVADLDRALAFYRDVLGFELTQRLGHQAAFLSAGGYHHHIGLNTWESQGGSPPHRRATGLYNVAIVYPMGQKVFESHGEAKTYTDLKTIELMNQGRESVEFPSWLRVMAQRAHDQLSPFGKTIADAVEFFLPHVKAQATGRPVADVVTELLSVKKKDGASDRYLKDLKSRLEIFAKAHQQKSIAEFTAPAIDDWLRGLPHSPVTRNNYKRLLGVLFSYAESRNYVPSNPAQKAEKAKVKPEKPGILTVEQASRLLRSASDEILRAIAIGLFAGLRPEAEVWRLDWSAIDLKEKLIDVTKSKNVASDRFVTVAENLCVWLKLHAKKSGPISPTGDKYHTLMQAARAAATASAVKDGKPDEGIQEWPSDCLRHSYASMHYAYWKNPGETAQQLGHGQNLRTFIRHYKNRVKPADAERYWKLVPARPASRSTKTAREGAAVPRPA